MIIRAMGVILVSATLLACSPTSFETPTVTVDTKSGPVVCQLYSPNIKLWDRADSFPSAMNSKQADAICMGLK